MLQALGSSHTLRSVNLSFNLLGVANTLKAKPEEPAILELAEVCMRTQSIEEINVSYNSIDSFALYCLSYGLERTASLKSINLRGNPIGSTGMRFLVQAVRDNPNKQFNKFLVDDTLTMTQSQTSLPTFAIDLARPEGDYTLDLARAYDRLKLRKLLDLDWSLSRQVAGTTFGQCFLRARLDNSKPWSMPRNEGSGNWVLEPAKGLLRFSFSLKHLKGLVPGTSSAEMLENLRKANADSKTVHGNDFSKLCKLLQEYKEKGKTMQRWIDNEAGQVDMIVGLAQDNKLWTCQAKTMLRALKSSTTMGSVLLQLLASITDRLLLYTLFAELTAEATESILATIA